MRFLSKSKVIIASVLTLGMVFSSVSPVKAAEVDNPYNLKILEDSDRQRVVETSYDTNIYVATYDKENDTMQISVTNVETSETKVSSKFAVGEVGSEPERSVRSASSGEKTFCNYEYKIDFGTPNVWTLTRPDGMFSTKHFKIKETSKNKADLNNYKSLIKELNAIEGQIGFSILVVAFADASMSAAGVAAVFSGGALSPAAIASMSGAVAAHGGSASLVQKWSSLCKSAYEQYYTIFYAYDTL